MTQTMEADMRHAIIGDQIDTRRKMSFFLSSASTETVSLQNTSGIQQDS